MASPVPSRVARSGYAPPNFNPNNQRTTDSLAEEMQNLQMNRPPGPPPAMPNSFGPRPPPFVNTSFQPPATPPGSLPGAPQVSRPAPPPAGFMRTGPPPAGPPPQVNLPPNMGTGRPSGPPFSQPFPLGSRRPFPYAPALTGPITQQPSARGPLSNGPPVFTQGTLPIAPRFPSGGIAMPQPVGTLPVGSPPTAPHGQSLQSFPGSPPAAALVGPPSQLSPSFQAAGLGVQAPSAPPYGSQMWQVPRPGASLGTMQPPRMYGMPPHQPNQPMPPVPPGMSHPSASGAAVGGPSKIDPNQIPRPIPNSSTVLFETRQNNQACIPPPATSAYVVKDTGNCSPRYMRSTISQIPCSTDLLTTSAMPLVLMVQPLSLPHPSEEPIQVVDFGESGPVRCSRCKGYINPFMKFIDQGRHFICNLCGPLEPN